MEHFSLHQLLLSIHGEVSCLVDGVLDVVELLSSKGNQQCQLLNHLQALMHVLCIAILTLSSCRISLYLSMMSDTAFSSSTDGSFKSLALNISCPLSGFAMMSSTSS